MKTNVFCWFVCLLSNRISFNKNFADLVFILCFSNTYGFWCRPITTHGSFDHNMRTWCVVKSKLRYIQVSRAKFVKISCDCEMNTDFVISSSGMFMMGCFFGFIGGCGWPVLEVSLLVEKLSTNGEHKLWFSFASINSRLFILVKMSILLTPQVIAQSTSNNLFYHMKSQSFLFCFAWISLAYKHALNNIFKILFD